MTIRESYIRFIWDDQKPKHIKALTAFEQSLVQIRGEEQTMYIPRTDVFVTVEEAILNIAPGLLSNLADAREDIEDLVCMLREGTLSGPTIDNPYDAVQVKDFDDSWAVGDGFRFYHVLLGLTEFLRKYGIAPSERFEQAAKIAREREEAGP